MPFIARIQITLLKKSDCVYAKCTLSNTVYGSHENYSRRSRREVNIYSTFYVSQMCVKLFLHHFHQGFNQPRYNYTLCANLTSMFKPADAYRRKLNMIAWSM